MEWKDAPTLLSNWTPCGVEYPNGFARFWPAHISKPPSNFDLEHQMSWPEIEAAMSSRGLCFKLDARGYCYVGYASPEWAQFAARVRCAMTRQAVRAQAYEQDDVVPYKPRRWTLKRD